MASAIILTSVTMSMQTDRQTHAHTHTHRERERETITSFEREEEELASLHLWPNKRGTMSRIIHTSDKDHAGRHTDTQFSQQPSLRRTRPVRYSHHELQLILCSVERSEGIGHEETRKKVEKDARKGENAWLWPPPHWLHSLLMSPGKSVHSREQMLHLPPSILDAWAKEWEQERKREERKERKGKKRTRRKEIVGFREDRGEERRGKSVHLRERMLHPPPSILDAYKKNRQEGEVGREENKKKMSIGDEKERKRGKEKEKHQEGRKERESEEQKKSVHSQWANASPSSFATWRQHEKN